MDTQGPVVKFVSQSTGNVYSDVVCGPTSITVVADATDPSGVTSVVFNARNQQTGFEVNSAMQQQSGGGGSRYTVTVPVSKLSDEGRYAFSFTAKDGRGNVATTTNGTAWFFDVLFDCGSGSVE